MDTRLAGPASPFMIAVLITISRFLFSQPLGSPARSFSTAWGAVADWLAASVPYNLAIQRSVTREMTLMINYAGNEARHVFEVGAGGNPRGYWVNQLNSVYLSVTKDPAATANRRTRVSMHWVGPALVYR